MFNKSNLLESKKAIKVSRKQYAVMLFYTEMELGISQNPGKWVCTNVQYFDNGQQALDYYANMPCPASQLVEGKDDEELNNEIHMMKENMQDEQWLNQHLYPYL